MKGEFNVGFVAVDGPGVIVSTISELENLCVCVCVTLYFIAIGGKRACMQPPHNAPNDLNVVEEQ